MDFNSFIFLSQYKEHRNILVVHTCSTYIEIIAKLQKIASYFFTLKMTFSGVYNKNKREKKNKHLHSAQCLMQFK